MKIYINQIHMLAFSFFSSLIVLFAALFFINLTKENKLIDVYKTYLIVAYFSLTFNTNKLYPYYQRIVKEFEEDGFCVER